MPAEQPAVAVAVAVAVAMAVTAIAVAVPAVAVVMAVPFRLEHTSPTRWQLRNERPAAGGQFGIGSRRSSGGTVAAAVTSLALVASPRHLTSVSARRTRMPQTRAAA